MSVGPYPARHRHRHQRRRGAVAAANWARNCSTSTCKPAARDSACAFPSCAVTNRSTSPRNRSASPSARTARASAAAFPSRAATRPAGAGDEAGDFAGGVDAYGIIDWFDNYCRCCPLDALKIRKRTPNARSLWRNLRIIFQSFG
jgi:hypothetical protein